MKKKIALRFACALLGSIVVGIVAIETHHRLQFGHFVGYGIHADVVESTGDIGVPGIRSLYAAQVTNYTFFPLKLVGWESRSDALGAPPAFYCRFQIQKLSSQGGQWIVLMDFKPTGTTQPSVVSRQLCPICSIVPMGRLPVAADDLRVGDLVRFAVFAEFNATAPAVYSRPFRIREVRLMVPSPARSMR